jgi:hypothetical protein
MNGASPPHPCYMKTSIFSNTAVRTSSLALILWYLADKVTNLLSHNMVYRRKVLTLIVQQTMNLLKVLGLSLLHVLQYQLFLYLWNHKIIDQISYKLFLLQLILSMTMQTFIPEVGSSNAVSMLCSCTY